MIYFILLIHINLYQSSIYNTKYTGNSWNIKKIKEQIKNLIDKIYENGQKRLIPMFYLLIRSKNQNYYLNNLILEQKIH